MHLFALFTFKNTGNTLNNDIESNEVGLTSVYQKPFLKVLKTFLENS